MGENSTVFRLAGKEDIETLIRLRLAYLHTDYQALTIADEEVLRGQLAQYYPAHLGSDCLAAMAVEGGQTASVAMLVIFERPANPSFPTGKTATLYNVFTHPEYRRKGYAERTVLLLIHEARRAGVSYIDLMASDEGRPLYEKLGFGTFSSDYTAMKLGLV